MTRSKRSGRLERVRTRSHRKTKLVMLALGATGAVLGLGFLGCALWNENPNLLPWGGVYLLGATGLLAGRQALVVLGEAQRQNRDSRRGGPALKRGESAKRRGTAWDPAGESSLP